MSDNEIYDLVIIGGGPGGLSAAIYAMRGALKTVLVEKGAPGGQINLSDEVENYPGFTRISGAELAMQFAEHAASYGLEQVSDEVTAVEPGLDFHTVRLAGGRQISTHAVVLATGGSPRQLGVPGENTLYGKGVSYCAVCDGFFFRDKNVAVVGGGDSACEEGLYLAKLAKQVYIIHRRDALRASMILQKRVEDDCNMEVLWNSVVSEIQADESGVNNLRLKDTQTGEQRDLPIDGVFIFIGFVPNNELVPAGVKLNPEGFVVTDEQCATSIAGIYAIGDLREKYARQIVLSCADGCMAALAAAHYVENRKAKAKEEACEI
ncbi:thioredoxin reductase (NADPH) [Desulfosalsimonas propionicica]|uniref:Thioredoxin reductase n=1 Tax=Desulfosalsimonas propionicica TaxID=332175 RepID=A0A7W0HJT1_9BACT|nr:thioredoxin-disulfide reductase [Desulfosalsimonas propionicica]MBA2880520.1 thioredoxin reductase (NADPH) [Desulfosalsimonas propionicica]